MEPAELQLLVGIAGVVIFVAVFLGILFSAIVGVGVVRLLYVGARWCAEKIHQLHTVSSAQTMPAIGRMVPHH